MKFSDLIGVFIKENIDKREVGLKFNFTDIEFSILVDLVYAGNWVINGCRLPDEIINPYKDMSDRILSAFVKSNKLYELHCDKIDEAVYARLESYFRFCADNMMFTRLAAKLAEHRHGDEATLERTLTEEAYREEFSVNGVKNIVVDLAEKP